MSVISTFFLAMTLHPEVQRKAHEEIDRVVGRDRLPTFADRDSLPYVEAVFKESFRWHALTPLGLPHVTTADDVCEGYLIPKGAIILPNIWFVVPLVGSLVSVPRLCSPSTPRVLPILPNKTA